VNVNPAAVSNSARRGEREANTSFIG
jgi:hypothetical protein